MALDRLISIMARLRDPVSGCDWDREQTFATIVPYTIEEAYEVADAIERNNINDLCDELGDLLLQVVFHARMAEEAGHFSFADVARSISDKLEARHPHVFSNSRDHDGENSHVRWERLKAAERAVKGAESALDGVALALPALMRAEKLQKRAARAGFDWPDPTGPADKVFEEVNELASANEEHRFEEAGDLLFAATNLVRSYGIAPEEAMRAANTKFERRFRAMEALAAAQGEDFAALSLDQKEDLWQAVKQSEPGETP